MEKNYYHNIINFDLYPYSNRHGRYGGQAGDKDGILMDNEYWMIKYPKSTRSMQGISLPQYTSSPLSEYIGSHIYDILGIPVHETLLGIRNNQLVVGCKDFQKHIGDLAEIRTIKNAANKQISEIADNKLPESATGDKVILEELLLHFEKNPLLKIDGLKERFWETVIIDVLIGNNDRNNGNWGLLFDENTNSYEIAPVYDNGNAFNNKTNDTRISELLHNDGIDRILGERTIYTFNNKILSAKNIFMIDDYDFKNAILKIYPLIHECLPEIEKFINSIPNTVKDIPIISEDRKSYYVKSIKVREQFLLQPFYQQVLHLDNILNLNSEDFDDLD